MFRHPAFPILLLALLIGSIRPAQAQSIFSIRMFDDPAGDTFAGSPAASLHDILKLTTTLSGSSLQFRVDFADPIDAPSNGAATRPVGGYIDLDVDADPSTGQVAQKSIFSPDGPSALGSEFFIDLFSELFTPGMVDVVDAATLFPVGSAPITYGANFLTIDLDLSLIGDDGLMNYGVIVGDFIASTDEATNPALPPATTIAEPEPAAIMTWGAVALIAGAARWRSRRRRAACRVS